MKYPKFAPLFATAALLLVGAPSTFAAAFGPGNPFYAPSTLPYHSPPFDRIHDQDYQPAIEAGMAQQLSEVDAIADNAAAPTFDNTVVALEKSGALLDRAQRAFSVSDSNSNPVLAAAKTALAPKLAAHHDAIFLNTKLFHRVDVVYANRKTLGLDPESLRLVEITYQEFVHAGARLSAPDKQKLRDLNAQLSRLSDEFDHKLRDATAAAGFHTADKAVLAGLSDADLAAASQAAQEHKQDGWLLPLQNTTTQPDLASLTDRKTRETILHNALNRAERGDANDTRATILKLAELRAQYAHLLGYQTYAAWKLEDQMARTPDNALKFMQELAPLATHRAAAEAKDIQAVIDAQKGGFKLQPWDWDRYSEQVRKAKYDLDESQVQQYFELNRVLQDGVFYAANQLYGLTFKERHDIPVYQKDVRVFEVFDADSKPLGLIFFDYFARDNKNGGAWMDAFVHTSKLTGDVAVVFNVANFPKPAPGQPALLSADDVTTMFHEFGHGLHEFFGVNTHYPTLSGTTPERDFVEFPSQFNEYWAWYPSVLAHYAKHWKTGAAMPQELVQKVLKARTFNKGYDMTEIVAAAMLDMQWHIQSAADPVKDVDAFEQQALTRTGLWMEQVPPRYRSTYFRHIWTGGAGDDYSAGYYAYLWTQMLADNAWEWFDSHGGLTRANGDRFRKMILSIGNTQDLETAYEAWRGEAPNVEAMKKYRGLGPTQ